MQLARHPKRPHTLDYITRIFTGFVELHGDRTFADDAAIVGGMAFFDGRPVMVIGQQKGRDTKQKLHRNFGMPKPEGYRKALRLMRMADKFQRPIITFLDTPGRLSGNRRRRARAGGGDCREPARDVAAGRAGDHHRDRRRRQRRRVGTGGREPRVHAGERLLQRDFARKLRRHHLSRFGQGAGSGRGFAAGLGRLDGAGA